MTIADDAVVAASRAPLTVQALSSLASAGTVARVAVVPAATSTNTELLETLPVDPEPWPHMSVYVADHQTAGRGRAGREWTTPAGSALTASFVIRPEGIGRAALGWAPLVTGLAAVRALRRVGVDAWLKWPNDVIVQVGMGVVPGWGLWRKCVGILCERAPGDGAIVAGIGVNVSQTSAELPVPHAASLATLGASTLDRVEILGLIAAELRDAVAAWSGDADEDPVSRDVAAVCATIGWDVAVDVPSGPPITGTAVGLSDEGALLVRTRAGQTVTVLAGDVRVRRT